MYINIYDINNNNRKLHLQACTTDGEEQLRVAALSGPYNFA